MTRLAGKVCAVTGASTGIGAAIAAAFAAEGAAVVGLARRFSAAEGAIEPGRVTELNLDVTHEADVAARFDHIGALDVLVNNAGVGTFKRIDRLELAQMRAMLDTHIIGTFLCTRAALSTMTPAGAGHILMISSTVTVETFAECSGYTAAKLGQLGLTRVLAEEARTCGVRVTTIIPGAVDTPIWDDRPGFDRTKMMRPDDLAALVVDVVARPGLVVEELLVRPPGGNL